MIGGAGLFRWRGHQLQRRFAQVAANLNQRLEGSVGVAALQLTDVLLRSVPLFSEDAAIQGARQASA